MHSVGLFVSSLLVCFSVAFWYGDGWDSQRPVGIVADISGASFAIAVVILSVGRVAMVMARIFRRKEKEEGRQEGLQEGLQEAIEADKQRREGESLAQGCGAPAAITTFLALGSHYSGTQAPDQ